MANSSTKSRRTINDEGEFSKKLHLCQHLILKGVKLSIGTEHHAMVISFERDYTKKLKSVRVIHRMDTGVEEIEYISAIRKAISERNLEVQMNVNYPQSLDEQEETIEKARRLLGRKDYHLLWNNCEHFVNSVLLNDHHSNQIAAKISGPWYTASGTYSAGELHTTFNSASSNTNAGAPYSSSLVSGSVAGSHAYSSSGHVGSSAVSAAGSSGASSSGFFSSGLSSFLSSRNK